MPDEFEVRNDTIEAKLRDLGRRIEAGLPAGWGFTLFLSEHAANGGASFYIASVHRDDMIRMVQEWLIKQMQVPMKDKNETDDAAIHLLNVATTGAAKDSTNIMVPVGVLQKYVALLSAACVQHQAIDMLSAELVAAKPGYLPSKHPAWQHLVQGLAAINLDPCHKPTK